MNVNVYLCIQREISVYGRFIRVSHEGHVWVIVLVVGKGGFVAIFFESDCHRYFSGGRH